MILGHCPWGIALKFDNVLPSVQYPIHNQSLILDKRLIITCHSFISTKAWYHPHFLDFVRDLVVYIRQSTRFGGDTSHPLSSRCQSNPICILGWSNGISSSALVTTSSNPNTNHSSQSKNVIKIHEGVISSIIPRLHALVVRLWVATNCSRWMTCRSHDQSSTLLLLVNIWSTMHGGGGHYGIFSQRC